MHHPTQLPLLHGLLVLFMLWPITTAHADDMAERPCYVHPGVTIPLCLPNLEFKLPTSASNCTPIPTPIVERDPPGPSSRAHELPFPSTSSFNASPVTVNPTTICASTSASASASKLPPPPLRSQNPNTSFRPPFSLSFPFLLPEPSATPRRWRMLTRKPLHGG
uniref:Cytochrome P450 monooxygenase CYP52X1 n=1 Tax=Ganoderma boninense TaxID=34458 RepID=A0A5K1JV64_9APHY|nr:Cytochrome P450 monooxygenase CYP52X1 [Ganoderma boninense]